MYQRLIDKYLQTDKIELTKAKIERTLRPCSLTKEQIERIRILILQISLNTKYKLKFTEKHGIRYIFIFLFLRKFYNDK